MLGGLGLSSFKTLAAAMQALEINTAYRLLDSLNVTDVLLVQYFTICSALVQLMVTAHGKKYCI